MANRNHRADWKNTKQLAREYELTANWFTYFSRRYKDDVRSRRINYGVTEVYVPDLIRIKAQEEEGRPNDLVPVFRNPKATAAASAGIKVWYKFGQSFVSAQDLDNVNYTPRAKKSVPKTRVAATVKGTLLASVKLDQDAAIEYLKSLAKEADLEIEVETMLRALKYVRDRGVETIRFRGGKVFSVTEKSERVTV